MEICMYCEYYNSLTGRCDVTGQEKAMDDNCKYHEHVPYDDPEYDWGEH